MKTENFKSLSITLLLVLLSSCRSNDTDNTLNPDSKANTTVKINLLVLILQELQNLSLQHRLEKEV